MPEAVLASRQAKGAGATCGTGRFCYPLPAMKFWVPYFLVAILGTAGVYYGTPPLWRAMGLALPPAAGSITPPAPQSSYLRAATPAETPAPVSVQADTTASSARHTPLLTAAHGAAESTSAPSSAAAPSPAAAGKPFPPPSQGSKSWGMTISRASYYALSGENRGQLPGGAIMDIDDSRSTDKGVEMSMGQVERNDAMVGPYLVANADLVRFNVPRREVPPESIALLKQYYGLKGQLDQRLADLKKLAASSNPNPYYAAYAEAKQKYGDFNQRVKTLTVRRDAASGADRMRYMDTLREMIPEGKRLERAFDAAQTKYNQWKTDHPGVVAPDATAGDPQVQELRKQLATLEPQVKEIVQ